MRTGAIIALVVCLGAAVGAARADTIYSNYSAYPNNGSYYTIRGPGTEFDSYEQGIRFTAETTAALDTIEIAAFRFGGITATGNVRLYTDSGSDSPGAVIETIPFVVSTSDADVPSVATSLLNPTLNAGTMYWVTVDATSSGFGWVMGSRAGTRARRTDGQPWIVDETYEATVRLNGLEPAAPVPLPAAAWAGMALFGLVGGARLRSHMTQP